MGAADSGMPALCQLSGSTGEAAAEVNAGGKARQDVDLILDGLGTLAVGAIDIEANAPSRGVLAKASSYATSARLFREAAGRAPSGSVLVVQFPFVFCHTPLFSRELRRAQRGGVRVVLLLHDLEALRHEGDQRIGTGTKLRIVLEERTALARADAVIAHNARMTSALAGLGVDPAGVVPLGIFDYLAEGEVPRRPSASKSDPVVVAGNLKQEKAGYLYDLPDDVAFRLFGLGFEGESSGNVECMGALPPNDLPNTLEGSFGLVWDGPSARSCEGPYGEYLRVNNPHKTSLYLASGLPVIIWDEAALAPFVLKNGLGLAVSSLHGIRAAVDALSDGEYEAMRARARAMGERLRRGEFTRTAVEECLRRLGAADGGDVRA